MLNMKSLGLFACAVLLLAWPLCGAEEPHAPPGAKPAAETKGFKNIGVEEFDKLRADKQNRVLDVRTPSEFAAGHIPGALNIDVNAPDFEKKAAEVDKKQ